MADAALDNANPTILSASQLPTRHAKRSTPRNGPDCKYSDLIFSRPSYLARPFCEDDSATAWPRGEDEAWGDAEPIDEQEIYGTFFPLCLALSN
jgi:hypothetical protein